MTLLEQINADIKDAMRSREKEKLEALRAVKAAFIVESTKTADSVVTDEVGVKIITKLVKQRKDSAKIYIDGDREELAKKELLEITFMEPYLPALMSDQELTEAVKSIIETTGASSMKEMGKVMGMASKQLAGKADGRDIADKVKALLA